MRNMRTVYQNEAQEWFDAACGYSKDDIRYDECMEKYGATMKVVNHLSTDEYFDIEVAIERAEQKVNAMDDALGIDEGWSDEEWQTLLAYRNAASSELDEARKKQQDYFKKIGI